MDRRVNGAAVAGGSELMLACDMAVASHAAIFGLPGVRRVPLGVAAEMIATDEPNGAQRTHALGLVNRLVAPGALLPEALSIAA